MIYVFFPLCTVPTRVLICRIYQQKDVAPSQKLPPLFGGRRIDQRQLVNVVFAVEFRVAAKELSLFDTRAAGVAQLVEGGVDLELVEIDRISRLDDLGAEEYLVEVRVLSDGFEEFVDAHTSHQVFEVEVGKGFHDQLNGKIIDVGHFGMVLQEEKLNFVDGLEMRGASSADDDVSCCEREEEEC